MTPDTLFGCVGNTDNAISTPPHLHLGIYAGDSYLTCEGRLKILPATHGSRVVKT